MLSKPGLNPRWRRCRGHRHAPNVTAQLVRECSALGIKRLWMHRSFGQGSVDEEAVRLGQELGLAVIPGSCPMMFCEPVDVAHKCLRWFLQFSGGQAKPTATSEGYSAGRGSGVA